MATPIIIDDPEAIEIASSLAVERGQSTDAVVLEALRHERERLQPRAVDESAVWDLVRQTQKHAIVDNRSADEMIYNKEGLPR